MNNIFYSKGQSLIVIIIILVAAALLGGSYYYFSRQIPEFPEELIIDSESETIEEKEEEVERPAEEESIADLYLPPADTHVIRSRVIDVDLLGLLEGRAEGDIISLKLFDEKTYECLVDRITHYDVLGTQSVRCRIGEHGYIIFTVNLDTNRIAATIEISPQERYQIISYPENIDKYFLEEIEIIEK